MIRNHIFELIEVGYYYNNKIRTLVESGGNTSLKQQLKMFTFRVYVCL